jgi:hypothetical protein
MSGESQRERTSPSGGIISEVHITLTANGNFRDYPNQSIQPIKTTIIQARPKQLGRTRENFKKACDFHPKASTASSRKKISNAAETSFKPCYHAIQDKERLFK